MTRPPAEETLEAAREGPHPVYLRLPRQVIDVFPKLVHKLENCALLNPDDEIVIAKTGDGGKGTCSKHQLAGPKSLQSGRA